MIPREFLKPSREWDETRDRIRALARGRKAVEALHVGHVCPDGVAALGACFIIHGGTCARVGSCMECGKPCPCPTIKAVRGESL